MSAALHSRTDSFVAEAEAWEKEGAIGIFIPGARSNDAAIHTDEKLAFPPVEAKVRPLGSRILVQYMTPITQTVSGIKMPDEARAIDKDNMQVAKILAVGPLAFHKRETGELWPEGAWCKPGDFVRAPRYPRDVFTRRTIIMDTSIDENGREVKHPRTETVRLAMINDLDLSAVYDSVEAALSEEIVG